MKKLFLIAILLLTTIFSGCESVGSPLLGGSIVGKWRGSGMIQNLEFLEDKTATLTLVGQNFGGRYRLSGDSKIEFDFSSSVPGAQTNGEFNPMSMPLFNGLWTYILSFSGKELSLINPNGEALSFVREE